MSKSIWPVGAGMAALVCSGVSWAELDIEVSGYLKNETSIFTQSGQVTGAARSTLDTADSHQQGDLLKFENSARFFLNGDVGESSSWHADINLIADTEGVNADYKYPRNYTQYDVLRELYLDTSYGDWDLRLGKQQVVWGTADGIKLLDIINPTDWREFNQNTMEDARIPIWMVNAERNVGDNGNIQFIISQHEESKFAGLNDNGDAGHPFIFKGVDSITGQVNGFMNIAPALGKVAGTFNDYAAGFGLAGTGGLNSGFFNVRFTTVQDFVDGRGLGPTVPAPGTPYGLGFAGGACPDVNVAPGAGSNFNAQCLNRIAQSVGTSIGGTTLGQNNQVTNMIDGGAGGTAIAINPVATPEVNAFWNTSAANSAFEYFPDAAFGTFNSFVNLNTEYRRDYPDETDPNFGIRYKAYTDGGMNFSVNYFYGYDNNPSVAIHYEDQAGRRLTPRVGNTLGAGVAAGGDINVVRLYDSAGATPCEANGAASAGFTGCTLVFEETVHRVHNIGGSFDTSFQAFDRPMVMRGEFLYQKDTRVPVIDRGEMAIGNLTEGLKSEKADMFKYVIGLDFNVLTNLFVSGQFIQFINLDYVDESSARNTTINQARTQAGRTDMASYRRYTGHMPTLHLDNGLNEGEEFENFYSFFLSKPFGNQQQHRWNNIIIYEQRGGWWNRFDLEYSFNDDLIGTLEWNNYWGDDNSMFGQFKKSSNLQAGVRYLF